MATQPTAKRGPPSALSTPPILSWHLSATSASTTAEKVRGGVRVPAVRLPRPRPHQQMLRALLAHTVLRLSPYPQWMRQTIWFESQMMYGPEASRYPAARLFQERDSNSKQLTKLFIKQTHERLRNIAFSDNPKLACRLWILEMLENFAYMHVALITPEDVAAHYYDWRFTGLREHIDAAIEKYFREALQQQSSSREDVLRFIEWEHGFVDMRLRVARFANETMGDGADTWYGPLFGWHCAYAERRLRDAIGLPRLDYGSHSLYFFEPFYTLVERLRANATNPMQGLNTPQPHLFKK